MRGLRRLVSGVAVATAIALATTTALAAAGPQLSPLLVAQADSPSAQASIPIRGHRSDAAFKRGSHVCCILTHSFEP